VAPAVYGRCLVELLEYAEAQASGDVTLILIGYQVVG
jgi:hypothetical protein